MEAGLKILMFMNTSPIFKGVSVIIVGLFGLLFWRYMKNRWQEPDSLGFKFFLWFSVFIVLYGAYILAFQPGWWKLPY